MSNDTSPDNPLAGLEFRTRAYLLRLVESGVQPLEMLSVGEARRFSAELQAAPYEAPSGIPPAAHTQELIVPSSAGPIALKIFRPANAHHDSRGQSIARPRLLPTVVYYHGGGWVLGDAKTYDRLVREICVGSGTAVVFVDYRRAPEARYPVAVEECYTALAWVAKHGAVHNLDATRIAIVGDSAGGNLAAVVAQLAIQRGGPAIQQQILIYPVTDANFDTASYRQFAAGPGLTRAAMHWFWNHYVPDESARCEPTASPLRAPSAHLRDLPPTLIVTAEFDVLRDDGEQYARHLAGAGVEVTAVRYNGTIHGFASINAITNTPAPRAAIAQIVGRLRSLG